MFHTGAIPPLSSALERASPKIVPQIIESPGQKPGLSVYLGGGMNKTKVAWPIKEVEDGRLYKIDPPRLYTYWTRDQVEHVTDARYVYTRCIKSILRSSEYYLLISPSDEEGSVPPLYDKLNDSHWNVLMSDRALDPDEIMEMFGYTLFGEV